MKQGAECAWIVENNENSHAEFWRREVTVGTLSAVAAGSV